ncbi:TPA: prepilin-type N-terminal cleavage/methylation domain-containing protein [Acinetobacter baumannii]
MKYSKGFTLLELMIVVAIIGVLAVIAFPQYQKYIAKAQFTELVQLATAGKKNATLNLEKGQCTAVEGVNDVNTGKYGVFTMEALTGKYDSNGTGCLASYVFNKDEGVSPQLRGKAYTITYQINATLAGDFENGVQQTYEGTNWGILPSDPNAPEEDFLIIPPELVYQGNGFA